MKLLVVGGGNMGSALIAGLLGKLWASQDEITVVDPDPAKRDALVEAFPKLCLKASIPQKSSDSKDNATSFDAVLAVKPDMAEPVCRTLGLSGYRRVLSVVAGMPTGRLEAVMGDGSVVIRAMPNTAVIYGKGVSAIAGGSEAKSTDLDWAEEILGAVGTVVRLAERHLDAVTGLSGSGPAYVFLVAEALMEAGVLLGLPRDVSAALVTQTIVGAGRMLEVSNETPEALRAKVTSPGGTTAAGLRTLEARGVRSAFLEAVAAATERSRGLAR